MHHASPTEAWAAHVPRAADRPVLDLLLEDGSLPRRFVRHWTDRPHHRQLKDVDGRWITSAELEQRTRETASRLRSAGLVAGDRFLLSAEPSADLVVGYMAALRAGLIVVPLNPAYTNTEVSRIVRDAAPAAAATDDETRAGSIRTASDTNIQVFGIDLAAPGATPDGSLDGAKAEDPALLVYTSGTTGQPKGALLTHGNLLASATAVNLAWRWTPEDTLLLTLPLFHVHGLGVGLNGSFAAGAAIVLRPRFDAADVAATVESADPAISLFFGVPAMYQRLLATGHASALKRLRLLVSGSAPLPAAMAEELGASTGQIPLERYGMTETVMLTSNPYDGPRRPGTVGLPLPGVRLRLDPQGEVEVTGPNVIAGYYKRPDANAEAFTEDGWFRTGDLGEFDPDGYLRLVGRSKDLIITGGYNVHPREVEEVIAAHGGVLEVAVVGRASDRWGEEVTAVVVADRPLDVNELRSFAAQQLAPYKVPKRFEFASELPRNALGKVLRGELK